MDIGTEKKVENNCRHCGEEGEGGKDWEGGRWESG